MTEPQVLATLILGIPDLVIRLVRRQVGCHICQLLRLMDRMDHGMAGTLMRPVMRQIWRVTAHTNNDGLICC